MTKHYDIAIVGASPAGLTVANAAGQLKYKVALIKNNEIDENYICAASKSFLYASKKYKDFNKAIQHTKNSINSIQYHDSTKQFKDNTVDIIKGNASFLDNNTLLVNGENITAEKFVLATGSRNFIPAINGLENVAFLTNETIFNLTEKPTSITILGAGPTGVKMATAFNNLGIKTRIIHNKTGILLDNDQELADILKDKLSRDGIEIFEDTNLIKVTKGKDGIDFYLECCGDEFILSSSHFLIATGRIPNTEKLDLDNANISYNENGFINVDNKMQTTNKNVYALGDITGKGMFTNLANHQTNIFIKRVLFGAFFSKANYMGLAWITYSSPELAQIGLTEEQAREIYGKKIKVIKADFKENSRAAVEDSKLGRAKLILDKKGRALGVSILGKNSGELIQQWQYIIQNKQKPSKMLNRAFICLTYSDLNRLLASKASKDKLYSKYASFISKLLFKYIGNKL